MARLTFDGASVKELYEHAKSCAHYRKVYGEDKGPGLFLVHDQGVYLMSGGIPHLEHPDCPENHKVAYAKGCNPEKDRGWWEEAKSLVGGDDFAEHIPIDWWDDAFSTGQRVVTAVVILLEKNSLILQVETVMPYPSDKTTRIEADLFAQSNLKELDDIV